MVMIEDVEPMMTREMIKCKYIIMNLEHIMHQHMMNVQQLPEEIEYKYLQCLGTRH